MTRGELISMMQDVLAGPDADAPDYQVAYADATTLLDEIEARGLCIVPREATAEMVLAALTQDGKGVWGAMIEAGRI